ncbi:hypothetical protein P4O66_004757 [Electrophorus voltai]|uniref:Uncharacterized protein n=1 Tax=Electrophorus voltai TaxID=2609070 RepID=A0AAD9DIQ0_9TELE|nr:hypothetical protein P4O66_004757 [Electrophorus voltai]
MGLISENDERAYLEEIKHRENWCQGNNLLLNVSKTKQLIVDCSKKQERHYQPSHYLNPTTLLMTLALLTHAANSRTCNVWATSLHLTLTELLRLRLDPSP